MKRLICLLLGHKNNKDVIAHRCERCGNWVFNWVRR